MFEGLEFDEGNIPKELVELLAFSGEEYKVEDFSETELEERSKLDDFSGTAKWLRVPEERSKLDDFSGTAKLLIELGERSIEY